MIKKDTRVLVVGMARSGIAAAKLLLRQGAVPLLNDSQTADAFGTDLDAFLHTSCEYHLGEDPVSLLAQCGLVVISPGVPGCSTGLPEYMVQVMPLVESA